MLNYTTTLDVCLEEGEKESKTIVQNVTEALLSFVCHDEGDRIACNALVSLNIFRVLHFYYYIYNLYLFLLFCTSIV